MKHVTDGFSFPRFGMLMKKYISENWRLLAMGAGLIFGVMIIIECIIGVSHRGQYMWEHRTDISGVLIDPCWSSVSTLFFFMLFILGSVCACMAFSGLGTKEKRIYSIMFPANALEEYFVRFVIYVPMFILVYIAAFYLGELVRVGLLSSIVEDTRMVSVMDYRYIFTNLRNGMLDDGNIFSVFIFISVQSVFVLGSILFPKNAFIKTFIAGVLIFIVFWLIVYGTVMLLTPENYGPYKLTRTGTYVIFITIFFGLAVFNYVLAYFRFRELEVINRW